LIVLQFKVAVAELREPARSGSCSGSDICAIGGRDDAAVAGRQM
jgi:hypothetical protein